MLEITKRFKALFSGFPDQQTNQKKPPIRASSDSRYTGRLASGEKWTNGISNNGEATIIDTARTLQNARSASHQSPQARVMIERPATLTVDAGLKLEPTPAWSVLGINDDDFKENWTADHELRFDMYMDSKQCHRAMTLTGYQLQQLWAWSDSRDNDQFGRIFYNRDRKLVSPVQLDFIDPTLIQGTSYVDTLGQHAFKDGIQRNEKNQEIAYKVMDRVLKNGQWVQELKEITAKGSRSGRVFMFHGFKPEYAGQGRGFSKLHFALQDFHSIVDYVSSVTQKAINQSGMVGFVEPSENAPASNPMEDQQGGPPVPDIEGDELITASDFCFERTEYRTRKPGSDWYGNLMPGEKMKFLQDTAPGPEFDKFITSIFKYVSAARGYPIEVILMAFNSNYSASRAALLEAWRTGRIAQQDIKADLMDIWWEMWLSEEIAAGRSQAPSFSDPRLKQAWLRYRLQGPTLPSISPRDDIGAIPTKLMLGLTTQEREARAINGSDAKQNLVINTKMFEKSPWPFWEDERDTVQDRKAGVGSGDNE